MTDSPIIKFPDGESVKIVDPDNIPPVYTDLLSEFREVAGVVYISFASFIIDGDGEAGKKARVVSRIRISRDRAATIYGMLGNMLGQPDRPNEPLN
jgi:hypothetical protein